MVMKNTIDVTDMTDAELNTVLMSKVVLRCVCCERVLTDPIAVRQAAYDHARGEQLLMSCDRCAELKPGPDGSEDGDFACDQYNY